MRREIRSTILTALIALLLFVPSVAQTKTPTAETMKLREQKALEALRKTPYRVKLTIETRNSETEEWRPYSCFITEYLPNRSYERRCAEPLREKIRIGKDSYSKMPDGTWQLDKKGVTRGTVKYLPGAEVEIEKLGPSDAPEGGSAGFGLKSQREDIEPN